MNGATVIFGAIATAVAFFAGAMVRSVMNRDPKRAGTYTFLAVYGFCALITILFIATRAS